MPLLRLAFNHFCCDDSVFVLLLPEVLKYCHGGQCKWVGYSPKNTVGYDSLRVSTYSVRMLYAAGLLISKYRVSSILYRRYFLSINGVIAATSENSYR